MVFSRMERWILANQYSIMELVAGDDHPEIESFRQARTILERGNADLYESIYPCSRNELSEEECQYVTGIMEVFYRNLPAADRAAIDTSHLEFPGFDGNDTPHYMMYAEFFCTQLGRFPGLRVKGGTFNSHSPVEHEYGRMLGMWNNRERSGLPSKEEILRLLDARMNRGPRENA